ncbi:MAG: hypothetical protein HW564_13620 [Ruegeria pomeroyi]|uniref:Uncharacterized protein n=2 Tax=Ruegeria pomeroyi TaxID=89184 RepID=A0A850LKF4_9RHOB|nr:hypothetical protein [Ruegeria pomeroyi]NVK97965.1 hypothetical protein [Ruegeria pomeroyi]
MFDRIRYEVTFDQNRNFLNEAISSGGALPKESENHFLLLSICNNLEIFLFVVMIACGMLFINTGNFLRSLIVSSVICVIGAIVGHTFSRLEPIRVEFFQSFLVATAATALIALTLQFLKKGNNDGAP